MRPLSSRSAVVSAVVAWACLGAAVVSAAPPAALEGSGVATVPADAAFFSSTLRLKEQIDRFMASNAYAKLRTLPAIARGLDSWQEQKDMPGSPVSMALTFMELPENAQAAELLSDMVASDTFVYGEPSCINLVKLIRIVAAAQQEAQLENDEEMEDEDVEAVEEISEAPRRLRVLPVARQDAAIDDVVEFKVVGGELGQALAVLGALAENVDLIEVPDVVWGFKTGKKETAEFQLKRIEVLAKLLAEMNPEAGKAMARTKVAGGEVLSFTIPGSLMPWDEIIEEAEAAIGESEDLDAVIAKVSEMEVVIGLGIVGDWVVLSIGDSLDHLDKLVLPGGKLKGKALIDTPPFAKLVEHADKPLTGISYMSEKLGEAIAPSKQDFEPIVSAATLAMKANETDDAAVEEVSEWLNGVVDGYVSRLPKPGAWLSFAFMTPKGYEGYSWYWSQGLPLDGGQPLGLLGHAGGTPIAVVVSRFVSDPALLPAIGKAWGEGWSLFAKYAVPEMDEEEREKFDTMSEQFLPLARELGSIVTDKFIASLADGQVGIVIDAKSTTDKLHAELPSSSEELPVLEVAIVLPLADRQLFVDGLNDFFAWGDKFVAEIRKVDADAIPEGYRIPEPTKKKVAGGSVWSFAIAESGLDKQIAPAIGVGDSAVIFTMLPAHAARLLEPAPLKTGGQLTKFAEPLAGASATDFPALCDAIEPWIVYFTRYGCVMASEGQVESTARLSADDETAEAAEALTHVRVALEVASCLKTAVSEMTMKDGALVTHWQNLIEDLPKP